MNDKVLKDSQSQNCQCSEMNEAAEWIASKDGQDALLAAFNDSRQSMALLEKDCRVSRESLYEPVTL
jgi:hypothetical protein